jgi:hypothetical protein
MVAQETSESANQNATTSAQNDAAFSQTIDEELPPAQIDPKERLEAMISKYGRKKGRMIADGKVWPTISFQMAKDSWGPPEDVQTTKIHGGATEKWIYSDSRYLFFKNGYLQSWRD